MIKKMVHGVGINDADYKLHKCRTVNKVTRSYWRCPFYVKWAAILERAYSEKSMAKNPTYAGVQVDPEWHLFSRFKKWMELQDWHGNEIDKDILFPGNKVYGPEFCIFVSPALNSFILDSHASRGKYPIGVTFDSWTGKLKATCRNPFTGKVENLGRYVCEDEAHEAWRKRKHEIACIYAGMQTDKRIADALFLRYQRQEI